MNNLNPLYVVTAHRQEEYSAPSVEVIGVFTDKQTAQIVMQKEFEKERKSWNEDGITNDYIETERLLNDSLILTNVIGCDYTEFNIWEREINAVNTPTEHGVRVVIL